MKTFYKTIIIVLVIFNFPCTTLFSQHWQALQKGVDAQVRSLYSDTASNLLYIGGSFRISLSDSVRISGIATWDGTKFSPVGCGFDWDCTTTYFSPGSYPGAVTCMTKYNGDIYAGGGFLKADNKPIKGLAKWNGITWDSVRTGVVAVNSFLVYNNELYISGAFDNESVYITKWDGATWTNLPNVTGYVTDCILDMSFYKGELYICGKWDSAGSVEDIYKWEGSNWKPVGNGIHGSWAGLNCMAVYNNELYVGGLFTKADGNPGNFIAKWDGSSWSEVGGGLGGLNGQVHDLEIYHNELYAVGVFISAGGVPAQYIAKWDGTNWCGLGSYFDNILGCVSVYQDNLYIGGGIWTIDGDSMNYIAKWTGGSYVDTCGNMTGVSEIINEENNINVFPNPTNGAFTISYGTMQPSIYIYNCLGKLVYKKEKAPQGSEVINLSAYSKGIYFIKVQNEEKIWTNKIIIQ